MQDVVAGQGFAACQYHVLHHRVHSLLFCDVWDDLSVFAFAGTQAVSCGTGCTAKKHSRHMTAFAFAVSSKQLWRLQAPGI